LVIGLFGGLGLFLFGMEMMSKGLQKSAGDKMRLILSRVTHNKTMAVGAGAVFTMIIQSSTAMAVMLMGFVNSRLMPYKSTIPILIGAAIGTTITAQLIAFKVTDFAIVFIGIGAAIYLFSQKISVKNLGEAILGFGFLFFGLKIMSEAMYPLRSWDPFLNLLLSFENPFLGIMVGALFTALIHSSSACIGIIMVFASQGLISLESGLYLLLGANLGTSATALIAGINTGLEARKVAYTELIYKSIMVITFVGLVPLLVKLLNYYSYRSIPVISNTILYDTLPRQIANAHTIINVLLALIILPLIPLFEKMMQYLFPEPQLKPLYTIKYLDKNVLSSPIIALHFAKQETLRLGRKIYILTDEIIIAFINNDTHALQDIYSKRDQVKAIRDEIKSYVLAISKNSDERGLVEVFQIIHVLQELSHINDGITKILHRRAEKWIDRHYEFSEESKAEILEFHKNTLVLFKSAIEVFDTFNLEKAKEIKKKKKGLKDMADQLEHSHYERLIRGNTVDVQSSKTQLEIIYSLNAISQNSLNIVRYFISSQEKIMNGEL
jgi:phosphate:Na+ symporter